MRSWSRRLRLVGADPLAHPRPPAAPAPEECYGHESPSTAEASRACRPGLEALERRRVPAQFGVPWHDPGAPGRSASSPTAPRSPGSRSDLFRTLDGVLPRTDWQREILRAFQTWAVAGPPELRREARRRPAARGPRPRPGATRASATSASPPRPMSPEVLSISVPHDPFLSGTWSGDILLNSAVSLRRGGRRPVPGPAARGRPRPGDRPQRRSRFGHVLAPGQPPGCALPGRHRGRAGRSTSPARATPSRARGERRPRDRHALPDAIGLRRVDAPVPLRGHLDDQRRRRLLPEGAGRLRRAGDGPAADGGGQPPGPPTDRDGRDREGPRRRRLGRVRPATRSR